MQVSYKDYILRTFYSKRFRSLQIMNINFWVEKTYVRFFFDFNDKEDLIFTIKILKKSNESFVEKYRINDGFATL